VAYRIEYSGDAEDHLRGLTARQRSIVLDTVLKQLQHQPTVETRNRKFMEPNPVAPWELRIRNLRVYYRVVEATEAPESDEESPADQGVSRQGVVVVTAVGVKLRNRVRIGGEEIELS
jgi:hypothetical protein